MEEILEYLADDDREYYAGIPLMQRYHRNKYLVSRLAKKDTASNRSKLMYELKKLASYAPPPPHPSVKVIKPKKKKQQSEAAQKKNKPENSNQQNQESMQLLDTLSQRKARLHQMRASVANQAHEAGSDLQRKQLYKELRSIQADYDTIAKQIEIEKAGGKTSILEKPKENLKELDPVSLIKKRDNLRSQRSRRRKILETYSADHPKSVKATREIKKIENEIEQIEKLITSSN